ncbi:ABC-F family ATP-binding cassette domain-containing protein [Abyssisolibacter fermentans]|uniref:ABC-F family ATP-binding cassette domain-containing protein n=1 Tax=Abyssisolibacter fermentans TaxID=1766203 RepID=UPI0008374232|nr:ABC-F family ATP-binding cassette domain-containing protein [Abyssisolibacter fermentans]
MNVLTVKNLSKSYGERNLFKDLSFIINDTDKIGLIGINGAGKSTLLKVLSGQLSADSMDIIMPKGITIEYLDQNPNFDPNNTILEQIFKSDNPKIQLIKKYERAVETVTDDLMSQKELLNLSSEMDKSNAWELENQAKTILTKLGITDFDEKIGELSGGQRKRVALCSSLITPSDLLILDEPTNHMDNETIDWLEKYLTTRKGALLMVTHDRYFLDRITNKSFELDEGNLYVYTGNYSEFLQKKLERKTHEAIMENKRQQLYKKELAWIRTGAKARTTKQKARIQRFENLKKSEINADESNLEISSAYTRLGKKLIEISNISKSYDAKTVINDFSYILLKDDRIGIVGNNGMGKSTLLNTITKNLSPDTGTVEHGLTLKIGYLTQESENMDLELRAIEYIKKGGEFITTDEGIKISASQMMEKFLFTKEMQWSYIKKLSGGEKRRLYLLRTLMEAPNVLILDEPTNDLDLDTIKILENYIEEFSGPVITVSHDRYFLDKICNKIFSFENTGNIFINNGNYSDYKEKRVQENINNDTKKTFKPNKPTIKNRPKLKFSYKEKLEYENIYTDIEKLETQIEEIDKKIEVYSTDYIKLQELMDKKNELEENLMYKLEREEYLSNLEKQINDSKKKAE